PDSPEALHARCRAPRPARRARARCRLLNGGDTRRFDSARAGWHAAASRITAVEEIARASCPGATPKVYRPGNSQAKGLQRFGTLERNRLAARRGGSPKETGRPLTRAVECLRQTDRGGHRPALSRPPFALSFSHPLPCRPLRGRVRRPQEPALDNPADRKYTPTHEWLRSEADGTAVVGITDHAQDALGELVYVE